MCALSVENFIDEIAKCTVLCSSCHKKLHNRDRATNTS
jgi:predicted HNH restriction endonuclease